MSFAYIDSQGKEVPIPGPDALRLRIELGAITDDTQFYDSATDRWASASEHEIYRQLKRELESGDVGGFVAPPPSTIEAPAPPSPEEPATPEEPESPAPDEPVSIYAEDDADVAFEAPAVELETEAVEEGVLGLDDLTFTDAGTPADPAVGPEASGETPPAEAVPDFGADDLTLTDGVDEVVEEPAAESGFDFGSGDLTLAEDPVEEAQPGGQWDVSGDLADSAPLPGDSLEGEPDFGSAFDSGDASFAGGAIDGGDDFAGGLEVESSDMSDFNPDDPPSWMEEESEESPEPSKPIPAGVAAGSEERADPYQRTIRERTGPRSAPPRRDVTPKSGGAGKIIGIVVALVVVGGGGAFFAMGMGEDSSEADEAAIELPALPLDLQPQLRQLAQRASQRMVEEFDSLPQRTALPAEPGAEWLSGRYLAGASDYPEVEAYWTAVGELLDEMRSRDDGIWTAAFEDEVVAANMTPENTELVRDRGLLGWEASDADREIVYDQLRRVIDASLELHRFLLANEADIAYTAVGAVGGDPFAEIEPASEALADELLTQVSAIPENLDALGYLQQVETEPLFGVVKEKLVATGIR